MGTGKNVETGGVPESAARRFFLNPASVFAKAVAVAQYHRNEEHHGRVGNAQRKTSAPTVNGALRVLASGFRVDMVDGRRIWSALERRDGKPRGGGNGVGEQVDLTTCG